VRLNHAPSRRLERFRFEAAATETLEQEFLLNSGKLLGAAAHLSVEDHDQIRVQLLGDEAPPSARVPQEMEGFMDWWEAGGRALPCLARASVAHIFFGSIHPFEDGNGRIGRAISELAVSRSLGQPVILSLSRVSEADRKSYYDRLAHASRSLEIGSWVEYFSTTILEAQEVSLRSVEFLVRKAHFFDRLGEHLNSRQEKALRRMFREGINGFAGGLSASDYRAITKATTATTTRDLAALVELGALRRTGERKHTRYQLDLEGC